MSNTGLCDSGLITEVIWTSPPVPEGHGDKAPGAEWLTARNCSVTQEGSVSTAWVPVLGAASKTPHALSQHLRGAAQGRGYIPSSLGGPGWMCDRREWREAAKGAEYKLCGTREFLWGNEAPRMPLDTSDEAER